MITNRNAGLIIAKAAHALLLLLQTSHAATPQISAGNEHSIALSETGEVWTWGRNDASQLGTWDGFQRNRPTPLPKSFGIGTVVQVSAGTATTAALNTAGEIWMWGSNGGVYMLGDGGTALDTEHLPRKVVFPPGTPPMAKVACGQGHTLAIDSTGQVWSWGSNGYDCGGRLIKTPAAVFNLPGKVDQSLMTYPAADIAAGYYTSYALDTAGNAYGWGINSSGQAGIGYTTTSVIKPTPVSSANSIRPGVSIKARGYGALMLDNTGKVWGWGEAPRLVGVAISPTPFELPNATGIAQLGGGDQNHLAVDGSGNLWTWGVNMYGSAGINVFNDNYTYTWKMVATPTLLSGWGGVTALTSSNGFHSLAMRTNGEVWSWGRNTKGQLGLNDLTDRLVPTKILNFKLQNDDCDADGIADSLEWYYFNTLSTAPTDDPDNDGLTTAFEVSAGTDPNNWDTDSDGTADDYEIDPAHNMNPLARDDGFGDPDGDGYPTSWEIEKGSDPDNGNSIPVADQTVSPGQGTLQAAVDATPNNVPAILKLQAGKYYGNTIVPYNKMLLIVGDPGYERPVITQTPGPNPLVTIQNTTIFNGVVFTQELPGTGHFLKAENPYYFPNRTLILRNCVFQGFISAYNPTVIAENYDLKIQHVTLTNCDGSLEDGIRLFSNAGNQLTIENSILWAGYNSPTSLWTGGFKKATATRSIISWGTLGGSGTDPKLHLNQKADPTSTSPGNTWGLPCNDTKRDMYGMTRSTTTPTVGAVEYLDTDADGLPDAWEMFYKGTLTGNGNTDTDGDRLIDQLEYNLRYKPNNPSTNGYGHKDLYDAVIGTTNPLYPATWLGDDNSDGISNGMEYFYYQDSGLTGIAQWGIWYKTYTQLWDLNNLADIDADNLDSYAEFLAGTNPFEADTDGDGVNDDVDPFPLDPSIWTLPTSSSGDTDAPVIALEEPTDATAL
jgi:alpha-tubulin suppressor-like RCC1 family protein